MPEVMVPLPPHLLAAIERMAQESERSRIAQIRFMLKQAVAHREPEADAQSFGEDAA